MSLRAASLLSLATTGLAGLAACRGDAAGRGPAARAASRAPEVAGAESVAPRTATTPANACGWIPVPQIEAIIGPLAGPPKPEGSACRYPLPLDSLIARDLERSREINRRLIGPDAPSLRESGPDEAAVIVQVDLTGGLTEERADGVMGGHFAELLGEGAPAAAGSAAAEPPIPDGWDYVGSPLGRAGFVGRRGHVKVTVWQENADLAAATWGVLAARLRDGMPDLPFARSGGAGESVRRASDPDPCGLLTTAEAEAVLGELLVPPYRAHEESPLADRGGRSCAYFTAGHHALVLTPWWKYGKTEYTTARGVAGLARSVAPDVEAEAVDTLEGPWDEAAMDLTGALLLLAGNRLLRLDYATSSTDVGGAVRLARLAVERLAAAPPQQ